MKKHITVIGGGGGSSVALEALKKACPEDELSAVIAMCDTGGSTGRLRKELGTLPYADLIRAIMALSDQYENEVLRKIFYSTRFSDAGNLTGHNLGNLFLNLSAKYAGSPMDALNAFSQAVNSTGKVFPATLEHADLVVQLVDGRLVKGEGGIDRPDHDRSLKIKKAWLELDVDAYSPATEMIIRANYLVIGPGSLYTSTIAALLPSGIKEAIHRSKAKIVVVAPIYYDKQGETGPDRLDEFIRELEQYLPRPVDLLIYQEENRDPVRQKEISARGWKLMNTSFVENSDNAMKAQLEAGDALGTAPEQLKKIFKEIII